MKPEDIAVVDDAGKQIGGTKPRTSEILLHLEIYHELPDINAVCHAHPPHATAFAVAGIDLPVGILPEVEIFIGQVPIAQYDTPGSKHFAETILPHLRNKCQHHPAGQPRGGRLRQDAGARLLPPGNAGHVLPDPAAEQADRATCGRSAEPKVRELLDIKKRLGHRRPAARRRRRSAARLAGSDEFLRGFSMRPIPQHTADANGHGRGQGIAGPASQAGRPSRSRTPAAVPPPTVAGRARRGG